MLLLVPSLAVLCRSIPLPALLTSSLPDLLHTVPVTLEVRIHVGIVVKTALQARQTMHRIAAAKTVQHRNIKRLHL